MISYLQSLTTPDIPLSVPICFCLIVSLIIDFFCPVVDAYNHLKVYKCRHSGHPNISWRLAILFPPIRTTPPKLRPYYPFDLARIPRIISQSRALAPVSSLLSSRKQNGILDAVDTGRSRDYCPSMVRCMMEVQHKAWRHSRMELVHEHQNLKSPYM
jgi:hypothetical protein